MKSMIQILIIAGLTMLFACKKENDLPASKIQCNKDYSLHPKNKAYLEIANKYVNKGLPGIAISVLTPGEGLWEGATGYSNIEQKIAMTPCIPQYAASIQKTYTAVMILQLIEEGKLSFNTLIDPYIPASLKKYIDNIDKITIEHLLLHNSGLEDNCGSGFLTEFFNDPMKTYTNADFLAFLEDTKPLGYPGMSTHHYSDANYQLLSIILDQIKGDHVTLMQDRIINKLNVTETYYHAVNYPQPPGLTSSYWDLYGNGKIENVSDYQNNSTKSFYGSGGLIVTPNNLTVFLNALFNDSLVSAEMIDKILTTRIPNDNENWANEYYGYGVMIIEDAKYGDWYGHSGRHFGASAFVFHNPQHNVTICIMTNMGSFISLKYTELIFHDLWNDLINEVFH